MSRIWNVLYYNRNAVRWSLLGVAITGLLGFFAFDVLAAMGEMQDETVIAFGAIFAYLGIYISILVLPFQQGYPFQLQISMGQTRKAFFLEQFMLRMGLLLVQQLMAYGLYCLESWKLRTFYPQNPMSHLDGALQMLFQPLGIFMVTFLGLSISLLIIALTLRFGAKASLVMGMLYLFSILFSSKTEEIAGYLGAHPNTVNLLLAGAVAIGVVFLAAAWGMIRRQQVN